MKYLKSFEFFDTETGNFIDYKVGDTVVCIPRTDGRPEVSRNHEELKVGKKYKVLKIYKLIEDKFLKNPFMRVDIIDEYNNISRGWESTRFKNDVEFDMDNFNL